MKCCNNDCDQGRKCPSRPNTKLIWMDCALALVIGMSLALALVAWWAA